MRQIVPAKEAELIAVAKAMHRENFGERVQKLFEPETKAAIRALETGVYVGWRAPDQKWDCIRVADDSFCFCGHKLDVHKPYENSKSRVPCLADGCSCKLFRFIPSRPEDVGEFWLKRRRNFDASKWRAKCRCKHAHTDHKVTGLMGCKQQGCRCRQFESNFLCAACDKHWEEHETFFDTDAMRKKQGLPYGNEYFPFAELPSLRNMSLTGNARDGSTYYALTGVDDSLEMLSINEAPAAATEQQK